MEATKKRSENFERMASLSIIPESDLLEKDVIEPRIKYALSNLLTPTDLESLSSFSSEESFGPAKDLRDYLERNKKSNILKQYSSFSLIPDLEEAAQLPKEISRLDILEKIMREEQLRKTKADVDLNKVKTSFEDCPKSQILEEFYRVKRRLDTIKRLCPGIFHTNDDIITVWGNMMPDNEKIFKYQT